MNGLNASFADAFDFRYPKVERIVFGAGCLGREAPAQLKQWGIASAVVVVNRSLADTRDVRELVLALGKAGVDALLFTKGMQHCPLEIAGELMEAAMAQGATAVAAIGGSSVSDTAKAANLLATFAPAEPAPSIAALCSRINPAVPLAWRLIAAPTTLSGGEFTPAVGISDPATGHKAVLRHPGLCSDVVLLDPELQRHTPDRLWAASGFKLLDHAVERLLARNHRPLIDAQCVFGAQSVLALLAGSRGGTPAAARNRGRMLQTLWVIQSSHGNVGTGLSHALAHQLGSACGLEHGCGSAICLPPTLRFLDASGRLEPARVDLLASAFEVEPGPGAIHRVLDKLDVLRLRLRLPGTLREAGVAAIDVDRVAAATMADPTVDSSPGRPITHGELLSLLEALNAGESTARRTS